MTITTNHPTSSYGVPVILGDDGAPLDYATGIREIRARKGWTVAEMGAACGVSPRTVEGWEQGRMPTCRALNALASAL